jgi:hypothetical protein
MSNVRGWWLLGAMMACTPPMGSFADRAAVVVEGEVHGGFDTSHAYVEPPACELACEGARRDGETLAGCSWVEPRDGLRERLVGDVRWMAACNFEGRD